MTTGNSRPGRARGRLLACLLGVGSAGTAFAQPPAAGPILIPSVLPEAPAADPTPVVAQVQAVAPPPAPAPAFLPVVPAFGPPLPAGVVLVQAAAGPAASPENTSGGVQPGPGSPDKGIGGTASPGAFPTAPGPAASPENTSAGSQPGQQRTGSSPSFSAVWNNGLFFQTENRDFVTHIGAGVQYDLATYSGGTALQRNPNGVGPFQDGVNPRRIRPFAEGTMYGSFDFKLELEIANGFYGAGTGTAGTSTVSNSPGPTDAYVQMRNIPLLGTVRIGNQKEWFSLERLNSYRYLEFLERSYLFDATQGSAFNAGFSPGISAFRTWADDRVFTGGGFYKNESDLSGFGLGNGQYAATGRVAGLAVWDPDNDRFWHVGGAMSHRDPVNGQAQVRVRDEVRNSPAPLLNLIANTGLFSTSSENLFNIETAAVNGSFTFQAEYTANLFYDVGVPTHQNIGTTYFSGFYTSCQYFLTGESRRFDRKIFTLQRVIPKRNFVFKPGFTRPEGWGAFELAARYQYLNLDDKGINGGRLNDVTLGLNWYWTPNSKMQFNYDAVYRDGGVPGAPVGAIHAFGVRTQVDF